MASGGQTAGFLVVVGLLVVGFGLATVGWVDYVRTNDVIADAEQTEVTVVESGVNEPGGSNTEGQYTITVVYEYEFDGESYRSSSVNPGPSDRSYSRRQRASAVVGKYPAGETAIGYVDPDDPDRSYLEQPSVADRVENNLLNAGVTVVGTLVFLFGAVGAVRTAAGIER